MKQHDEVSYLGMVVRRTSTGDVFVHQQGYLESILQKYGNSNWTKKSWTPATEELTESDDNAERCNQKKYLSLVMSLMFLARFTRPDILMPVSFLATRCKDPSQTDWKKALRIVHYLSGTKEEGLLYRSDVDFVPTVSADA